MIKVFKNKKLVLTYEDLEEKNIRDIAIVYNDIIVKYSNSITIPKFDKLIECPMLYILRLNSFTLQSF